MTDELHVTLSMLRQAVRESMKEEDPDAVISSFLSKAGELAGAGQAFIFDDQSIYPYSWKRKDKKTIPYTFSPQETYCAEVISRLLTPGQILEVEDVPESQILDRYTKQHFAASGTRNFLALGLHLPENHAAVITLENIPLKQFDQARNLLRFMELFLRVMLKNRDDLYKLRDNSYVDQMTGVYNRNAFNAYLHNIKREQSLGVMYADINNLKQTNDRKGHASGDQLIRDAATILHQHCHGGQLFRLGGDEFIILWQKIGRKTFFALGQQLRRHLREQNIDMSLGFYWVPRAGSDVDTILRTADKRMYDEKQRNHEKQKELLMDPQQFEQALENGEFDIYIQPVVDLNSERICGGEVLVRYCHDGVLLEPDDFLPPIKNSSFILTLDKYVWEQACRFQRRLLDWGLPPSPLSVNISARDFYLDDIAQVFTGLLKRYNLSSNLLFLEVKEKDYLNNSLVYESLVRLTRQGIVIIVDDFGMTLDSLHSLGKLNARGIKTQARYTATDKDEYSTIFFNSILNTARRSNMFVVAKGIEQQEQTDFLKASGCPCGQGYYWYRPLEKGAFARLISQPEKCCSMEDAMLPYGIIGTLTVRSLIVERVLTDDQISKIIGPMATLSVEKKTGRIELQQVNQAYYRLLDLPLSNGLQRTLPNLPTDKEGENLLKAFKTSEKYAQNGYFLSFSYTSPQGQAYHLAGRVYPISKNASHHYYFLLLHRYRK